MLPTNRPPTHPGEMLLKEFLEPLGVSQVDAAARMNIPFQRLNAIVKGRRAVSADTALLLEALTRWDAESGCAFRRSGTCGMRRRREARGQRCGLSPAVRRRPEEPPDRPGVSPRMPLMTEDRQRIAADFDVRASNYSNNQWHRVCAEALIAHSAIRSGDRVLDAGVGTGFAAIAAARRVGSSGHVVGVDVSAGMLRQARVAVEAAQFQNVELRQADACDLRELPSDSFDVVICAAALLYMPVQRALSEWRRLLKPGGTIGFSTMCAGFPRAGRVISQLRCRTRCPAR